jgi:hypothetical protein
MRRSGRVFLLFAAGLFLLAGGACKCGKEEEKKEVAEPEGPQYESTVSKLPGAQKADVAALIPQDSKLVVISDDSAKLMDWLEKRDWFQEIKKTPFYDDLRFTGTWFRLSTIKHRIESVSKVRVGDARFKEMLKTPAGLAFRPKNKGTEVLLVKQIDLQIRALDRLAEVFNQIIPREGMMKSRDVQGLKLRELTVDEQHKLYYLLFSNMLLVSNSEDYLLQATELARGQTSGSIADDSEIAALLLDGRQNYDLLACLEPAGWEGKRKRSGMLELVDRLMLRFKAGEPPKLEITGVLDKKRAGQDLNVKFAGGKVVPLDSRMVLGLAQVDLPAAWKRMQAKKPPPDKVKNSVADKLLPALGGQALVLLGGVEAGGKRPVPHAGLLIKVDKQKVPDVVEATGALFSYLFGEEAKKRVLRQMSNHEIWMLPGDQAFNPGFSVVGDWLVLCTSEKMLRKILATWLGHEPAIGDLPGFADKVAGERPYFFMTYLDCGLLFEDLKTYFRSVTKLGERFDEATVEDTVTPLLDALKKTGKIGGAVTQRGAGITGSVVPL